MNGAGNEVSNTMATTAVGHTLVKNEIHIKRLAKHAIRQKRCVGSLAILLHALSAIVGLLLLSKN